MADETMDKLAEVAVEAGTEATSLLFTIMASQRQDAEWIGETIRTHDERRIATLEADNDRLRAELAGLRGRVEWLMYGGPFPGTEDWA